LGFTRWKLELPPNGGGATTLQNAGGLWGAFTLGSYILGDNTLRADPNNTLFQHEYGHYLQSQSYGFIYLPKFAIPSLYDAMRSSPSEHDYYKVEQDANARALSFFVGNYGNAFAKRTNEKGWNHDFNPIKNYNWSQDYNSVTNQSAIKNAKMGLTGLDIFGYALSFATFYTFPTYSIMSFPWYWAGAATVGSYGASAFGGGAIYY